MDSIELSPKMEPRPNSPCRHFLLSVLHHCLNVAILENCCGAAVGGASGINILAHGPCESRTVQYYQVNSIPPAQQKVGSAFKWLSDVLFKSSLTKMKPSVEMDTWQICKEDLEIVVFHGKARSSQVHKIGFIVVYHPKILTAPCDLPFQFSVCCCNSQFHWPNPVLRSFARVRD